MAAPVKRNAVKPIAARRYRSMVPYRYVSWSSCKTVARARGGRGLAVRGKNGVGLISGVVMMRMGRLALWSASTFGCMVAASAAAAPAPNGEAVYAKYCASCHEQVGARIPQRSALEQMSPTRILKTLDF